MQWSKQTARSFLPKDVADARVMEFVPQKLDLGTPAAALEYVQRKQGSDFRMNEHVQVHTGVDQIEKMSDDERVERRALEMLAEIQRNAFEEAHRLGLDEGRRQAFEESSADIKQKMERFEELLGSVARMKTELGSQNESHIVKLMFHMASRIAGVHLEKNDQAVVEILRTALSLAQEEEDVRVEMNPQQVEFIEKLREQSGREFEFLKKIKFVPNEKIRTGGCVVSTNYGEIDSRFETRLEQLWSNLGDAIPKVKDTLSE